MINLCLALIALSLSTAQDPAERMLRVATYDQPLVNVVVVDAPLREVWKAWTAHEAIESWMVAKGTVDLKIGGAYRTSYNKDSNLDDEHTIVNTILAYDPERMLAMKNTRAPSGFPFKKSMENMWTVIYFEPVGETQTRVTVRGHGFGADEESMKLKEFFRVGNQQTLDALSKRFSSK